VYENEDLNFTTIHLEIETALKIEGKNVSLPHAVVNSNVLILWIYANLVVLLFV